MSQFEYVTVLMSFVVAFAVSEILSGWGRQYLVRHECPAYPLQLVGSVLLLVCLLQTVWGTWNYREISWSFGGFLLALAPFLPLAGAAHLIFPPSTAVPTPARSHYFDVYRAVFVLLAAWVVLTAVPEVLLLDAGFHAGQVIRLIAVVILLALAYSPQARNHWIGISVLAILQVVFIATVIPSLR